MIARMVDLPTGIGRTTYTLCLYRSNRPHGVRHQTLAGVLPCYPVARAGRGRGQGRVVAETGQEVYRRLLLYTADKGVAQLIDTLPVEM